MTSNIMWIGIVIAVLGAALLGGYFMLRGTGNPVAAIGSAQGTTVGTATTTQSSAAPATIAASSQPENSSMASTTSPEASGMTLASTPSGSTSPAASSTTAPGATSPQAPAEPAGLVPIEKLIKSAADYDGREVTIKGEILAQCTAGCEFSVDDGTGVLSAQLEGDALDKLLTKGSVGKKVEVTGIFHSTPRPQLTVEKLGSWRLY